MAPSLSIDMPANSPQTPTTKFAHLGYQGSLEKARRTIAENEISRYQEQKARQKKEQAQQRRLKAEQLMIARRREEDEKRTGEELGAKLLDSLKHEVLSRMEAQLRDEARVRAEKDRHVWYDEYTELEKSQITEQLREELEPMVKAQLTVGILDDVKQELRSELTPEVLSILRDDYAEQVESEVRNRLESDLRENVIKQLREDNFQRISQELREEHRDRITSELRSELQPIVSAEIRSDQINEAPKSQATGDETVSVHESSNQTDDHQLPTNLPLVREFDAEDVTETSLATNALYPDIQDEAQRIAIASNTASEPGSGEADLQNPEDHGTGEVVDDPVDHASGPDDQNGGLKTGPGAYETAPESRDFTFNPEIHNIRFSSPRDSDPGKKRSFSASEDGNGDDLHLSKRAKSGQYSAENENGYDAEYNDADDSLQEEDDEGLTREPEADGEPEYEEYDGELESGEEEYSEELEDDTLGYERQQRELRDRNGFAADELLEASTESEEDIESGSDSAFDEESAQPVIQFSNTQDTAIELEDSGDEVVPEKGEGAGDDAGLIPASKKA